MHVMGWESNPSLTGLLTPSGHSRAQLYRRGALLSLRYDHARSMRNALAGNLSPSLTACNTKPRWPCTRWLIGALLLLVFSPRVFILELICRWPLGYWPPITIPGDLLPDFSATWSTCHPASSPRGYLQLTSLTTDDRPDHKTTKESCTQNLGETRALSLYVKPVTCQYEKRTFAMSVERLYIPCRAPKLFAYEVT